MDKDLIIGMATGYGWDTLAPFVNSLKKSGYTGRTILVCEQNIPGVERVAPPKLTMHPFKARHPLLAQLIPSDCRYVLSVDTKDVIFQSDPTVWLEENLKDDSLVVATEGITFRQCQGFNQRLRELYPDKHDTLVDLEIMNAGVIAGRPWAVKAFHKEMQEWCLDIPGDDDEVPMNVLLRGQLQGVKFATVQDGFVCNWNQKKYEVRDGLIYPQGKETPYAIWHQWQYWGDSCVL